MLNIEKTLSSVNILVRDAMQRTLLQMRDSAAASSPLLWGFWGGAIDPTDANPFHAAARELNEELGLACAPEDFTLLAERCDSRGRIAQLMLYKPTPSWKDIEINEGAGAGFFWRSEIAALPVAASVTWHLAHYPQLFADHR